MNEKYFVADSVALLNNLVKPKEGFDCKPFKKNSNLTVSSLKKIFKAKTINHPDRLFDEFFNLFHLTKVSRKTTIYAKKYRKQTNQPPTRNLYLLLIHNVVYSDSLRILTFRTFISKYNIFKAKLNIFGEIDQTSRFSSTFKGNLIFNFKISRRNKRLRWWYTWRIETRKICLRCSF